MTLRTLHPRSREGRANAGPSRKSETITTTDELDQSLIDTFPASDPPSWIPLARIGIPKRKDIRSARKEAHL